MLAMLDLHPLPAPHFFLSSPLRSFIILLNHSLSSSSLCSRQSAFDVNHLSSFHFIVFLLSGPHPAFWNDLPVPVDVWTIWHPDFDFLPHGEMLPSRGRQNIAIPRFDCHGLSLAVSVHHVGNTAINVKVGAHRDRWGDIQVWMRS